MDMSELKHSPVLAPETSLINILGVVYAHKKTSDGGDLYLTRYGLKFDDLLEIENWYDPEWFNAHRERLAGTSSVFRVPTREVDGRHIDLVVKNCRVGEDVPIETHTLYEFINAEFNSPWEEFSLVMEMREGKFGPKELSIKTQLPLAIYVPPERLQLWQTGRSREKINKITRRHPGINLDILRQYKLVYQWIDGLNIIEANQMIGVEEDALVKSIERLNAKAIDDMEKKGYVVADMKPSHIIIHEREIEKMQRMAPDSSEATRRKIQSDFIDTMVAADIYSIIDYELLLRTPEHETKVKNERRHRYLDDQRDRFKKAELPPYLNQVELFNVPYVHGWAESTGGLLWVVGCNPGLFDFFLPERWRRTPCHQLSPDQEIYYTITKDNVHIVWKTSRVGEKAPPNCNSYRAHCIDECGYNSPFEEFGIAHELNNSGVPTVYIRAIYMTGNTRIEPMTDPRHYGIHRELHGSNEDGMLREDRNYITIRGFYNGPDSWVATHSDTFYSAFDLVKANFRGIFDHDECESLMKLTRDRLKNLGYDGTLLELNDVLVALGPDGRLILDNEGHPELRICNFELIHSI